MEIDCCPAWLIFVLLLGCVCVCVCVLQYHILREKGTEPPGSGQYNKHYEKGIYKCAGCGTPLYKCVCANASAGANCQATGCMPQRPVCSQQSDVSTPAIKTVGSCSMQLNQLVFVQDPFLCLKQHHATKFARTFRIDAI